MNKQAVITLQKSWIELGTIDATTATADGALGVAERDFASASLLDNSVYFDVAKDYSNRHDINKIEVRFILTTNNEDVDIDIWACRGEANEMTRVCTLDVICGQQDADDTTHHYADTCNISNNKWITTVEKIVPGTDHQARIVFDLCGYEKILFHGYGTFDEDTIIEVSGY